MPRLISNTHSVVECLVICAMDCPPCKVRRDAAGARRGAEAGARDVNAGQPRVVIERTVWQNHSKGEAPSLGLLSRQPNKLSTSNLTTPNSSAYSFTTTIMSVAMLRSQAARRTVTSARVMPMVARAAYPVSRLAKVRGKHSD